MPRGQKNGSPDEIALTFSAARHRVEIPWWNFVFSSTHHDQLPGKYSVEAMYERLLDIAGSARRAEPDVYVVWYGGVRSTFFALHGDSIFELGVYMEGSGTSWFPALYYRDSVTLNLDQSTPNTVGTWRSPLQPTFEQWVIVLERKK